MCLLERSYTPEISVPVGGRVYVRLYGECSTDPTCIGNQIDNEKYGYPGNAHTTTFNEDGWFSFAPTLSHAGHSYDVCAKTIFSKKDYYTCMTVNVKSHQTQFISSTTDTYTSTSQIMEFAPANEAVLEATVGRTFELPLPVDTLIEGGCDFTGGYMSDGFECKWSTSDGIQVRGSFNCPVLRKDSPCTCSEPDPYKCEGACECMSECPLGPLPSVQFLPDISVPKNGGNLPEGSSLSLATHTLQGLAVTTQTRAQPWAFKWQPSHSQRNTAPSKMCFGAYMEGDPAGGAANIPGELRCYSIRVSKCRQCVQGGDTMGSIAVQHKTDWLHLYHANPSLPGLNPSHLKSGHTLRLGVSYNTRWGDDLERISQRFLVSQSSLEDQNPELVAPTAVTYFPDALGAHTQVTLAMRARRRVMEGENITVTLPGVEGQDWDGLVSEKCDMPVSTLQLRAYCSPRTHAVNDACGPGLWGRCTYDSSGVMGCRTHECNDQGLHPFLAGASWDRVTTSLVLVVGADIEAGHEVRVVVSQSAGLKMPTSSKAPTAVHARVPVPEMLWDPVAEEMVPMKLCVVLPVCQSGIECIYGSDCHLRSDTVAQ
eukprot:CAMPEP_0179427436 /NCGR_PEP_ID=MMETSP0799-20121207/13386_1 /TAXON_ID=46947 /ORGANISM="Geminigera cryophila, Strain CCMP2564" /LENGTH=596 /DNA_ID=CAMNT_0021202485 /DNA_START=215 /DNA_END=2005 /DNA_ORIENTATION=+